MVNACCFELKHGESNPSYQSKFSIQICMKGFQNNLLTGIDVFGALVIRPNHAKDII